MPPIRIAPGTFAGGTRFMDIAVPMAAQALAGMFEGKRMGEQTSYERQQRADEIARQQAEKDRLAAIQGMATLIDIHGPDAVKMPAFQEFYQKRFGRAYPQIPVMETQEVTPAVPGRPEVPAQDVPIESVSSPAETRMRGGRAALGGPQTVTIPGEAAVPGTPAVTQEVQVGTQPAPLGGGRVSPTLGSLGLFPANHPLAKLTIPEAKSIGFDVDKMLFPTQPSKEQAIGKLITLAGEGKATPQQMMVLDMLIGEGREPRSLPEMLAQAMKAAGYDPLKLPPALKELWDSNLQKQNKVNTMEAIRAKIAKSGLASLTEGERALYYEEIARRPEKYSWNDYKLDVVQGRLPMPTDPDMKRMVVGAGEGSGAQSDTEARQLRMKLAGAEAEFARIKAEVQQVYIQARPGQPVMSGTFKEMLRKMDGAAANMRAYQEALRRYEGQPGQQAPAGAPTSQPQAAAAPDAMSWARQSYNDAMAGFQRQAGRKPTLKEFMDSVNRMNWPRGSEAYKQALIDMARKTLK